ncbi:MAG: hemolysin III family protein [Acidimicrobiales bacterium]|nr:hemolysin III family protein [Actinomycetota bacterium]
MTNELLRTPVPDTGGPDELSPTEAVVAAVFPLLRGWLHLVCFFLSIPAGLVVVDSASPRARTAAIVYAIGLTALFGVSAAYHRGRWSATARPRMKRADHATIFVMIAGSYTPLCLVALGGSLGRSVMLVVWLAAGTGVVLAATGMAEKPIVGSITYIGLGWLLVLILPELTRQLTDAQLVLILVGGLLYTVGSVFLATRWPDPYPTVFGYHEIWHVMVVAAAVCHYVAILSVVKAAA